MSVCEREREREREKREIDKQTDRQNDMQTESACIIAGAELGILGLISC